MTHQTSLEERILNIMAQIEDELKNAEENSIFLRSGLFETQKIFNNSTTLDPSHAYEDVMEYNALIHCLKNYEGILSEKLFPPFISPCQVTFDFAISILYPMLSLVDPKDRIEFHRFMADYYAKNFNNPKALANINKYIYFEEKSNDKDENLLRDLYKTKGFLLSKDTFLKQKKRDDARQAYMKASITGKPDSKELYELGIAMESVGTLDQIIELFKKVKQDDEYGTMATEKIKFWQEYVAPLNAAAPYLDWLSLGKRNIDQWLQIEAIYSGVKSIFKKR